MNARAVLVPMLVLSLTAPALARRDGDDYKVLGWAGSTLLYQPPAEEAGEANEMGGSSASVTFGLALDGRTGLADRYFLGASGEPTAAEKKTWKAMPGKPAWAALVQAGAPACASSGRSGPGGATLDVELKGAHMRGAWKKDVYGYEFADDGSFDEKKATLTMKVTRGGKSVAAATWSVSSPNAQMGAGLSGTVRACWSPDGRRVALVAFRASGMLRDPGEAVMLVGPTAAPRVQLVADKAILVAVTPKVGAALEAAGFAPTSTKASNEATPRATSVVYAAAGFEADAARLAAAVPGGATVAKLDWKAPFDLVVGIGATATK